MTKKTLLIFLCLFLFLSIPSCKKNLPTTPDFPDSDTRLTIEYFYASPTEIYRGERSTLHWSVKNATKVELNDSIGIVSATDTIEVTPDHDIQYVLTATKGDEVLTQSATVTVNYPHARVKLENADLYFSIDHAAGKAYVQVSGVLVNFGDAVALNVRLYVHLYDANGDKLGWACTIDVFERLAVGVSSFNKGYGSSSLLDYVAFADAEKTLNRIEVKFESE